MIKRIKRFVGRPIPGGWHFHISDGPDITGENFDDLCKKLSEYKAFSGLPRGNPEAEITAYYAKNFPFTVENVDEEPAKIHETIKDYVHRWTNSSWHTPCYETADPDVIAMRQDICQKCPFRVDVQASDSPEDVECERRIILMTRGAPCPDETGWCSHHEWDNRLACQLPRDRISRHDSPDICWAKP